MSDTIIVIPNHLPHLNFLKEWDELKQHEIIVIQDIGAKPKIPAGFNITIYDHKDIEKDLGKNAWIIPTRTSACRSYGYYKAWQRSPLTIVTLDNDCYPERSEYFILGHQLALSTKATLDWVETAPLFTRGFPYLIRNKAETLLNHGLWSGVPDLDGATMLQKPDLRLPPSETTKVIPRHNFFPMCGMNLAWRTSLTPALYFGLFGPDYGFDQYDDLWPGVIVKKILDHLGYAVRSGYPSVEHRKQSDAFANIKKQAPGLAMNEIFWREVQQIELTHDNIIDCYKQIIVNLPEVIQEEPVGWTAKFKEAALIWIKLFE
jgi:hypothetical protein